MLTITGQQYRFCDGLSRRGFLTVGGLAMGGLTLPQLLRAEAQQGAGRSHKAIINIFLPGGPPHQDMWDLKPNAPKEVRGEFEEISTNVPGIRIGDQFPLMAKMMDYDGDGGTTRTTGDDGNPFGTALIYPPKMGHRR